MQTIVANQDQIEPYVLSYLLQKRNIPHEVFLNASHPSSPVEYILLSQQWIPKTIPLKSSQQFGKYYVISKACIIQHYRNKLKTPLRELKSSQILTEIKKRNSSSIILLTDTLHTHLKFLKATPLIPKILHSLVCLFKDNQPRKYKCVSFARNLEIIPPIGGFYSLREAKTRKTPLKSAQKCELIKTQIGIRCENSNLACKPQLDKVLQAINYRKGEETLSKNIQKSQFLFFPSFVEASSSFPFLCSQGAITHFQLFTGIEINSFLCDIFKLAQHLSQKKSVSSWNEYLQKRKTEHYQKLITQLLSQQPTQKQLVSLCPLFQKFPQLIFNDFEFAWAQ